MLQSSAKTTTAHAHVYTAANAARNANDRLPVNSQIRACGKINAADSYREATANPAHQRAAWGAHIGKVPTVPSF